MADDASAPDRSPWGADACSLVDAFRSGERTPVDELERVLAAISTSHLNAFSFIDADAARAAAAAADVSLPLGGVPIGVKELQQVRGWPDTEACTVLRRRIAPHDATMVARLREAGAVLVGLTTSSEFGGVNLTRTRLNGVTRNPWQRDRTPGGSSGGSAAAVAGSLVTLATAGDGGGSIRIPAGFCGLVGLKTTYGRIPKGPHADHGNLTAVPGCVSRSVRDTARLLDVVNGFDARDARSLPREHGFEAGLGNGIAALGGARVAYVPGFGGASVAAACASIVADAAAQLVRAARLREVAVDVTLPSMGSAWSLTGLLGIRAVLGEQWPACEDELTPEIRFGLRWAEGRFDERAAADVARRRVRFDEAMADVFAQVDFVLTSTNPDVAFAADGPLPSAVDGVEVGGWNNGRLTAPSNLYGNPAITVPIGTVASGGEGALPVGLQILAAHHRERDLLDLAALLERERPWPLVAPVSPG